MNLTLLSEFLVDKENKTITIKREFAANRAIVWDCYTKSEILDQWWIPAPYKSITKSMDFREGGRWHYAAVGPNGEEHWAITTYIKIEIQKMFLANDAFGDADGNINTEMPQSTWTMNFTDLNENTLVHGTLVYPTLEQLEQTVAMGFKEGLTMAMANLDALLAKG